MRRTRHGHRSAPELPIAFVGTYPPRLCGIATFTRDLSDAMIAADPRVRATVLAVTDARGTRFSVDRMTDEYLHVYQEVLRDHRLRTNRAIRPCALGCPLTAGASAWGQLHSCVLAEDPEASPGSAGGGSSSFDCGETAARTSIAARTV